MPRIRTDTAISISLDQIEKQRWRNYADKCGVSLSEFVRKAVRIYMKMLDKKGVIG